MAVQAVELVWKSTANEKLNDILADLLYSSQNEAELLHDGTRPGRAGNIERHHKRYTLRLHQCYFFTTLTYPCHLL